MHLAKTPAKSNALYAVEMPDSYDDVADWLMLSERSDVPTAMAALRSADEIALIPAIFDGDAHLMFGLHPDVELALFVDNGDGSWSEVTRCKTDAVTLNAAAALAKQPSSEAEEGEEYKTVEDPILTGPVEGQTGDYVAPPAEDGATDPAA